MDKKGIITSTMADLLGWLLFIMVVGIAIWLFMLFVNPEKIHFDTETMYNNQDISFLNILKSPVGDKQVVDYIADAYVTKNPAEMEAAITNAANKIYGRASAVCWKLYYYEDDKKRSFADHEGCEDDDRAFMDGEAFIPLKDGRKLKIQLVVEGE